jgi:hypothetical protein
MIGQFYDSSRWGIVSVFILFVTGAFLLWRIDELEGQRITQSIEPAAWPLGNFHNLQKNVYGFAQMRIVAHD